ncbi:MAG: UpxY family transcription antiterminator [Bacteroides sp.]|nr:UpxY family transcription antiterminator [Bacteroides sp.]
MTDTSENNHWYVMRDLKRANALTPAYKQLAEAGFEVFTPMVTRVINSFGRRKKLSVPFMSDLLFVCSTRDKLDPLVRKIPTLQYRYVKGAVSQPMEVSVQEMDRFRGAVETASNPMFLSMDEIAPEMYGANIRIISDGILNNYEGRLLKIKGSGKKRIMVCLKESNLVAAIEITASDYVEVKV